jgi:hypothetical protein
VRPTVGRTVHYVAYGTPGGEHPAGACRAAVVTEVPHPDQPLGRIGLAVLNPTGVFFNQGVPWADAARGKGGTWHWPERAEEDG